MQAFDGYRRDGSCWLPDVEAFLSSFDPAGDPSPGQLAAHIVVFTVHGQLAIGSDHARKGVLIHRQQPAIWIDGLWDSRERREGRAGHPRRLVATGTRLVGPLIVVMDQERLGDLTDLGERGWPMHL